MAQNIRLHNRDQQFLLAPSVAEWLPTEHLAWTVIEITAAFDLDAFRASLRSDGRGGASYDPSMMVAVVLYAYCIGVRSSRQIEKRCMEDVAFRVVAANALPDHTTVSRFVATHEQPLAELFSQMLHLCVKANMINASLVALDGTKIMADASADANREVEEVARRLVREAIELDEQEDRRYGDRRGDEVPEVLRDPEWIRRELAEAQRQRDNSIEKRPSRKRSVPKINLTDPESRMMKTTEGIKPAYNSQAVATEDQVIVASNVTQESADNHQLAAMSALARAELARQGTGLGTLLADGGYWSSEEIAASSAKVTLMPLPGQTQSVISTASATDVMHLFKKVNQGALSQVQAANALGIDREVFRRWITTYNKDPNSAMVAFEMRDALDEDENRSLLSRRKVIIEPIFGQMKFNRGFRRFRRRGLSAARCEWKLMCTTHNLLKYWRIKTAEPAMA
jgi:transposase